jgi:hypothetical protein
MSSPTVCWHTYGSQAVPSLDEYGGVFTVSHHHGGAQTAGCDAGIEGGSCRGSPGMGPSANIKLLQNNNNDASTKLTKKERKKVFLFVGDLLCSHGRRMHAKHINVIYIYLYTYCYSVKQWHRARPG